MKNFPMFIKVENRQVIIVGGGEQAAQKTRLLLKTCANLTLLAPDLDDELTAYVEAGRVQHRRGTIKQGDFVGATLVFIATGSQAEDERVHALAKAAGAMINVVDRPDLCDMTTPSIVDRDPVVVAIGTEGTAPVLGRQIKTRIEEILDPKIGGFANFVGGMRGVVAEHVEFEKRRGFWRWVFAGAPMRAHKRGEERLSIDLFKQAIANKGAPDQVDTGTLSIIGVGSGERDLLTLRAVERLQEADVIYYDDSVGTDVLELARRDAMRECIRHKPIGENSPSSQIEDVILSTIRRGSRVVKLVSGSGKAFATPLVSNDFFFEIVPGVADFESKTIVPEIG